MVCIAEKKNPILGVVLTCSRKLVGSAASKESADATMILPHAEIAHEYTVTLICTICLIIQRTYTTKQADSNIINPYHSHDYDQYHCTYVNETTMIIFLNETLPVLDNIS